MTENFFETHVRTAFEAEFKSTRVREIGDSAAIFAELGCAYPARGAKIDWTQVPGAIEKIEENQDLQSGGFLVFFDEIVRREQLTGVVIYVGDSVTDFALAATVDEFRKILPELLDIPQHHYLVGPDASWCMSLSMEGEMGFGFRPSLSGRAQTFKPS